MTGWTFDEIDNADATRCDWLLCVDDVVAQVRIEQAKKPAE